MEELPYELVITLPAASSAQIVPKVALVGEKQ
jgi:hypothetical protein